MTSRAVVHQEATSLVGRILTFDRRTGYGFIRADRAGQDDPDVFFHVSVLPAALKDVLKSGDRVEFEVVSSPQGLKAAHVRLIDSAPPPTQGMPERMSQVEYGMAIAPALAVVADRALRSDLSTRLLAIAKEHRWVE